MKRFVLSLIFAFFFSAEIIAGGTISGRLLKSSGKPLAYTEIELVPVSSEKKIIDTRLFATSDTAGNFVFRDVPAGKYDLSVNFGERPIDSSPYPTFFYPGVVAREAARIFEVEDKTRVNNLIFKFPPALAQRKIGGKITDSNGEPAKNILLSLRDVAADEYLSFYSNKTDAAGNYSFTGFETREYQIVAIKLEGDKPVVFDENAKVVAVAKSPLFIVADKPVSFDLTLEKWHDPNSLPDKTVGMLRRSEKN